MMNRENMSIESGASESAAALEPTVFVVDDDPDVRASLRWLIGSVGLKVEAFAQGQEFLDHYDPTRAGCLVLDVRMPGMSGLELQDCLRLKRLEIPIIFITGHGDVPIAIRSMKAGAFDFLQKPFNDQDLLERIQQAIKKDALLREQRLSREHVAAQFSQLTPRENQVLQLVVAGKANKQIGTELDISQKTVEIHRAKVMKKLQASSIAELVRLYLAYDQRTRN